MHVLGASSLGQCKCLTRPHVLRNPRLTSNGNIRKTAMKSSAYQVEVEAPEGVPAEEVMKRFKNESRRVNVLGEVRRRRYFENYQDMLKRKEKQKHMNKRMAKFDKFIPRLADKIDPHSPVPFGEMFGQGIDDLIGQGGGFGPDSLFGSFDSPFARKINNPDSEVESSRERAVGQWGSRKPSGNGVAQSKSKGRNVPEAPITARARKAAQAANVQGQQSAAPSGKNVTAKGQPKQKQPVGKSGPGKPATATPNKAAAAAAPPGGEAQNGAQKQQQPGAPGTGKANGAKRQWPNAQQRKNHKQNQQTKTGSPAAAKAKAQTQKKEPVAV